LILLGQVTAGAGSLEAPPPPAKPPEAPVDDWIELEVVYDDGSAYAGSCVLEMPNGNAVTRTPGAKGLLRFDGIPSGSCNLRFN
jgi:hypothetical protein